MQLASCHESISTYSKSIIYPLFNALLAEFSATLNGAGGGGEQ